ncbi:hypothetical protein DDZ18_08320 [Marinicauda salina]|uniref:EAL domain-containing protein n=1 Tax=Marinicauda salina TaxID=2135793 RepID=A0A2U2BUL7_9PROT|nr:EAL domain-containing protein [Marinicauda salina]PWE17654.1 hypothetical protein DDZ18_08320 [Marinicauda salina]
MSDPDDAPFAAAVRAAGAVAVSLDLRSARLALSGEAGTLGLARCAQGPSLEALRAAVAPADRDVLDAMADGRRCDARIRIVGDDHRVRYARLIGGASDAVWRGLVTPAGADPDGGRGRLEREAALAAAVDAGDVLAYHQPIVALASERLIGFEALARWRRPGEGVLGPDDFFDLAIDLDLVGGIGEQVRRAAIHDLSAWRAAYEAGRALTVSANATAGELTAPGFADALIGAVRGAELARGAFRLEINETEVMRDPDACAEVLHALRAAGVGLALDDFGTGYSSLARLDRFPFDVVKVDQYFVRAMIADPSAMKIVASVVKLARNLGMATIAEGVETAEMADLVAEAGCDAAQGFHYAGALPPEAAAETVRDGLAGRFGPPA